MSVKGKVNALRTEQSPARNLRINRFGNQYSVAKILNNELGRMETFVSFIFSEYNSVKWQNVSGWVEMPLLPVNPWEIHWPLVNLPAHVHHSLLHYLWVRSSQHSVGISHHVNLTGYRCLILSKPFNSWTGRSWASFSQCIRSLFTQMSIDVSNALKHAGRHLCKRWAWLHCRGCALQLVQLGEKKKAMESGIFVDSCK